MTNEAKTWSWDTESWRGQRVLITGAHGFLGANLAPQIAATGCELITPTRQDYNLLEQREVRKMFQDTRPDLVFHLAGLVGGALANREHPAEFIYQNLLMGTVTLHEAWCAGVKKFVALMGGCSYPAEAPNPIKETELWRGYPHPESAPYSLAKAMGSVQAEAYRRQHGFNAIVLVPGNLYGPHDNFDLRNSHVVPALIRKLYEARLRGDPEIVMWGSGRPVRDFIYVKDACEAILLAARRYNGSDLINLSSGVPITIRELVETVVELTGYRGQVRWDTTKPEGQMFKGYDVTRMKEWLGYSPPTRLRDGLRETVAWFEAHYAQARL